MNKLLLEGTHTVKPDFVAPKSIAPDSIAPDSIATSLVAPSLIEASLIESILIDSDLSDDHLVSKGFPEKLPGFHAAQSYYHVVLSGNRRKALFSTVDDRRALNAIAIDVLHRFDARLHAYCLMTNHFRALVQIDDRLITKALRRIATRYSRYRQRRLKSALHLFERPYTAQRVDTDGDFLNLLRCIHLTPVIANKVVAPADYLWSSHRAYLGYRSVTNITTELGLSLLAADLAQARVAYYQFINEGVAEDFERSINRKSPANGRFAATHLPAAPPQTAQPQVNPLINSRSPLPTISKPALPRFNGKRKRALLRKFLSVY